jgi:hypothetical protein
VNHLASILVDDLVQEGIVEQIVVEELWSLEDLFFEFGRVDLRGGLDINVNLGGLRNAQGPPQDPIDPDKEPGIEMRMVS